jgi:transcriptional regulator with XRE-family HTH domain
VTFKERFHRLMTKLNLSIDQLAEIFGVSYDTMLDWTLGRTVPHYEFRATLLRLESENMPALSPHLRAETLRAFREGRERVVLEES